MKAPMMNPTTPSLASRNNLASIDYREKLSLKANEIGQLRFLSSNLDDAEEFNVMTTILQIREQLKFTPLSRNFTPSQRFFSSRFPVLILRRNHVETPRMPQQALKEANGTNRMQQINRIKYN